MLGILPVSPTQAEVKSMHVLSTARGRGVGTALLDHIMKRALESGVQQLLLETGSRDASAPARRLYERAGFTYCPRSGRTCPTPKACSCSATLMVMIPKRNLVQIHANIHGSAMYPQQNCDIGGAYRSQPVCH